MKTDKMLTNSQIRAVLDVLSVSYPDAAPELNYANAFELLIAAILSAQCTDVRVNKVTSILFTKYTTPQEFSVLNQSDLEADIITCGLYRSKAKNIIATCQLLCDKHGGTVPSTHHELLELPGVGRKVANVVLSNAFGIPAIAVDTHVFRVSNRIGLADSNNVLGTEQQLMECIPESVWSIAHHWLIFHGRRVCFARNPACPQCPIQELCLRNGVSK